MGTMRIILRLYGTLARLLTAMTVDLLRLNRVTEVLSVVTLCLCAPLCVTLVSIRTRSQVCTRSVLLVIKLILRSPSPLPTSRW